VNDLDYMRRALALAERGRGTSSPNPMVGALVVSADGVVVGAGYHARAGGPHAEVVALEAAGARARGATLYVTLEPCCHTGRTGPCVERIVAAGIRRVVAAVLDPNPRVRGGGVHYLRAHGLEVTLGVAAREAARLNAPFFTAMTRGRPFVILKAAVSLDGRVAGPGGRPVSLTAAPARRHAHLLRAEVDAIGVGSETVLQDDPELTAREVYRARPLVRVIFDRRLRTPPTARVLSTLEAGPVIIVTSEATVARAPDRARALEAAGAVLEPLHDASLPAALRRLGERQIRSLLLEGGPTLHGAAWSAGVVDRVRLYVAPAWLGPEAVAWLPVGTCSVAELDEVTVELCGPDVVIDGYVHRAD
jgi:diaminohydroxyphosphoribosylaminopyrimidine deaminase/5-amino-6-(5-phosphoribosylamino)uracil reductase